MCSAPTWLAVSLQTFITSLQPRKHTLAGLLAQAALAAVVLDVAAGDARARIDDRIDRAHAQRLDAGMPQATAYRARTTRGIPVVILESC